MAESLKLGRGRAAAGLALVAAALVLGGLWAVILAFVAACAVLDAVIPASSNPKAEADHVFGRLVRARRRAALTRRARRLEVLEDVHPWARRAQRRELGLQSIGLDTIAGTVEPIKARQFDGEWRPDRSAHGRWQPLWLGRRSGSPIPPVSVLRVDGAHWVRDGHHRVSVAFHQDAPTLEAEIIELRPL